MIDETYVIERFDELIAIRNVMISKQIYDEKIAKSFVDLIFQMLFQNSFVVSFRKRLIIFNENDERWIDENDVFRFEKKLYVSKRIRFDVLQRCHDDFFANHFEMNKTLKLLRRKYYWFDRNHDFDMFVDMFEFVKNYCESCVICKRSKTSKHKSYEELQSLFVFQYRWADFTMNFVTNLSTSKDWNDAKYDNILVVVDRFTKMTHYILVTKTIKIKNLTKMLIRKVIRYHDFFNFIIIDRESLFTFEYYSFLCYALKIKKKTFTAFHSQIDEQTKRQNNIMKQYFRTYVNFAQNNWIFLLLMIEFAYNNANHVSTNMSSFKINLNYNFRMTFEKNFDSRSRISTTLNHSKKLRQLIAVFKNELIDAQRNQTRFKNKRNTIKTYNKDDMIWLNVKNIKIKRNNKFEHRFFESFKIFDTHEFNAYKLTLSNQWHIHDVFHVFLLKRNNSKKRENSTIFVTFSFDYIDVENQDSMYQIREIVDNVDFETNKIFNRFEWLKNLYYLINWKNYEEYDRTWKFYEKITHLKKFFRQFHDENFNKSNDRKFISTSKSKDFTFKSKIFKFKKKSNRFRKNQWFTSNSNTTFTNLFVKFYFSYKCSSSLNHYRRNQLIHRYNHLIKFRSIVFKNSTNALQKSWNQHMIAKMFSFF
jgi:hypothetical protein